MDPYIGEVRCFSFGKIPQGWLACNGQILQIQQYSALYSLLGTHYGGDGAKTFGLPDLRGRVPVHINLSGKPPLDIGGNGGVETVTLTAALNQLPQHTHMVAVSDSPATQIVPTARYLSNLSAPPHQPYAPPPGGSFTPVAMAPDVIGAAGMDHAHANMQPYSVLNFCIATVGIYPMRP
jgi:microcystin-dependent protein